MNKGNGWNTQGPLVAQNYRDYVMGAEGCLKIGGRMTAPPKKVALREEWHETLGQSRGLFCLLQHVCQHASRELSIAYDAGLAFMRTVCDRVAQRWCARAGISTRSARREFGGVLFPVLSIKGVDAYLGQRAGIETAQIDAVSIGI
jgi:hypothetical protein